MAADVAVAAQATSSLEAVAMNDEEIALGQEEGGFPCAPTMFIAIVRCGRRSCEHVDSGAGALDSTGARAEQLQPHAHHARQRRSPRH